MDSTSKLEELGCVRRGGCDGIGVGRVWQRGNERSAGDVGDNAVGHINANDPGTRDLTGSRAGRHRNGAGAAARTRLGHAFAAGERRTIGESAGFGCADSGRQR